MDFSEEFELRLEFECITDRFSSGYLNISDLLKNNKFTFSGLDSFQEKASERVKEHDPNMYSIGDDDENEEEQYGVGNTNTTGEDKKQDKVKEFEEVSGDENDDFDNDELDDDEYFKKLEEEA